MNMAGGTDGYPIKMKTGRVEDGTFFFTAVATKNEASFKLGPQKLAIDLPIKVKGVQDNGCTAVYSTVRPWFRFVSVMDEMALFQEPIDKANDIWVGNVFVADSKDVKITLVVDGLAPGVDPFLELHNPNDKQISTTVRSPQGTPNYGGASMRVLIPAGQSVRRKVDRLK